MVIVLLPLVLRGCGACDTHRMQQFDLKPITFAIVAVRRNPTA
jgi:hypothetical protein